MREKEKLRAWAKSTYPYSAFLSYSFKATVTQNPKPHRNSSFFSSISESRTETNSKEVKFPTQAVLELLLCTKTKEASIVFYFKNWTFLNAPTFVDKNDKKTLWRNLQALETGWEEIKIEFFSTQNLPKKDTKNHFAIDFFYLFPDLKLQTNLIFKFQTKHKMYPT